MRNRVEHVLYAHHAFDFTAFWSTQSHIRLFYLFYYPFLMHVVLKVEWFYMVPYEKVVTLCSGPTLFLLSRVLHFLPHISNNRTFISPFLGFSVLDLICWPPWKIKDSSLSQLPPLVHTQTDTQTRPISLFFNCDETSVQCLPSYVYTNNIYMGATQLAIISSPVVHKCLLYLDLIISFRYCLFTQFCIHSVLIRSEIFLGE